MKILLCQKKFIFPYGEVSKITGFIPDKNQTQCFNINNLFQDNTEVKKYPSTRDFVELSQGIKHHT